MAMSNNDNYSITVIWGKFTVPLDDGTTVQRFCWNAIATHTRYTEPINVVPTGWTDITPDTGITTSVECYANTWDDMCTKLSALATFWNE